MTTPFYSIRSILESKLTPYIAAGIPGVAVHKGITDDVRVLPQIIVYAESASAADALGSKPLGNYQISLKVYVYSSADDETLDTHRARVQEVMNLLNDDDAVKSLYTPATDGQIYDLWINSDDEGMSQRRYGNVLDFTVFAVLPPAP